MTKHSFSVGRTALCLLSSVCYVLLGQLLALQLAVTARGLAPAATQWMEASLRDAPELVMIFTDGEVSGALARCAARWLRTGELPPETALDSAVTSAAQRIAGQYGLSSFHAGTAALGEKARERGHMLLRSLRSGWPEQVLPVKTLRRLLSPVLPVLTAAAALLQQRPLRRCTDRRWRAMPLILCGAVTLGLWAMLAGQKNSPAGLFSAGLTKTYGFYGGACLAVGLSICRPRPECASRRSTFHK